MFKMIARNIKVNMFIGICDFEYLQKQPVVVNFVAHGNPKFKPENINDCLDYSKICTLVHSWADRPHVDLVESLLTELIEFGFIDSRILALDIEILKPNVILGANEVGVGAYITREQWERKSYV